MAKVRIAVIGVGAQGRHHINECRKIADIELVAVCDNQPAKLDAVKAEFGIPHAFGEIDEVLSAKEVEAVIIALPNYLHAPVTIKALASGKHVLVEKPMALNPAEAKAMIAARDKAGKLLLVGQNNRFRPEMGIIKEKIDNGELGEIYNAETSWWRRRCGQRGWFIDKKRSGGGALLDIGVHALDVCWWLMGCPQPEYVLGMTYSKFGSIIKSRPTVYGDYEPNTEFTVDDMALGLIKFTDGRTLYAGASWAANLEDKGIVVNLRGDKAGIVLDSQGLRLCDDKGVQPLTIDPAKPAPPSLHQHFVACIMGETAPITMPEQGLQVMKMLAAIYESAKTGGVVHIQPEQGEATR